MKNAFVVAATLALVALPSLGFAQTTCNRGALRGTWYVGLSAGGTDVSCQLGFSGRLGRFTGSCRLVDTTEYPVVRTSQNVQGTIRLNASCGFQSTMSVVGGPILAQIEGYASTPTSGLPVVAQGAAYLTGVGGTFYAPFTMHRRPNSPSIPWSE